MWDPDWLGGTTGVVVACVVARIWRVAINSAKLGMDFPPCALCAPGGRGCTQNPGI